MAPIPRGTDARRPAERGRLAPALLAGLAAACASEDYTRLYATAEIAPSLSWEEVEAFDTLGPTVVDRGVNFTVYSEDAERVELLLFDDPESDLPTWQVPLVDHGGGLWNIYVEGIGVGQTYGYIAWGPNWPYDEDFYPGSTVGFIADVDADGNRFNPNKLLYDPWGKAIHRDFDWSGGSPASGPNRYQSTYQSASKTVILDEDRYEAEDDYPWSEAEKAWREARRSGEHEGHDWNELVIYEAHPKGFTRNPASGVEHPGTFRGIGEMAPYLADLGVNVLYLMPVHEKPLDGGYWGYNTLDFFAPEHTLSADWQSTGEVERVLDEFRWMVDQLHQHGIEVMLDVVYNHTGEGGLWRQRLYFQEDDWSDAEEVNFDPKEVAGLYSYRGLDNAAWYVLDDGNQGYHNGTGVGNQTRANYAPMKRLVLDSLHFMVEQLHVDGFRFDLASVLGAPDGDPDGFSSEGTLLNDIVDDPILQEYHVRLVAEPWALSGSHMGGFPAAEEGQGAEEGYAWAEWNGYFRDWWRAFVNDCNWSDSGMTCVGDDPDTDLWTLSSTEVAVDGGGTLTGSEAVFSWNGRKPWHSVNFVTVHDGFTMYDLVSFEDPQNGCGLVNPICCTDPMSVWCDDQSGEENNRSFNWGDEALKRQAMRNLFTAMFIAHGTPLVLGGDEWLRTQYGNNNAYTDSGDNEWNWFRWGEWRSSYEWQRYRMHDFVRKLIRFRREHAYALSPVDYGAGMPLAWKDAGNADKTDWSNRHLAIHYYDDGNWGGYPELYILINMESSDVTFTLPEGRTWGRVVDTQAYYDTPGNPDESGGWFDDNPTENPYASANATLDEPVVVQGGTYTAKANSIVILEEQ